MNIEKLNAKVDSIFSTVTNSQEKFTKQIDKLVKDISILTKKVKKLEEGSVNSEEGFTNMSNFNLPPIISALLITLLVYILNQPNISDKLNFGTKFLKSDNLKLIVVLIVSYVLIMYN